MSTVAVGVVHGAAPDITQEHLLVVLDASRPLLRIRRLGETESVALIFA